MADPVVHFEITHKDAEQLRSFYEEVFSWRTINTIPGPVDYATVDAAEGGIAGGIGGVPDENYPGHVTFYVQVDDPAATLKKIEERGGKTLMGPDQVPGGPTIALFNDPSENMIGLVKGDMS
jgi:predicted enzyme related to lactoylglutathione lyase